MKSFYQGLNRTFGALVLLAVCTGTLCADEPYVVPELDPGFIVCGLTVAAAGALILTDRWLRKPQPAQS